MEQASSPSNTMNTPLSNSPHDYFLIAIPTSAHAVQPASPQRLRFHSIQRSSVVLTAEAPKLIRFHTKGTNDTELQSTTEQKLEEGQIVATSWKSEHNGRWWGLVLDRKDGPEIPPRHWEEVRMVELDGTPGFHWVAIEGDDAGRDELIHDGAGSPSQNAISQWTGWCICDWSLGLKQLFWISNELKTDLPSHLERVRILREPVWGQPQ